MSRNNHSYNSDGTELDEVPITDEEEEIQKKTTHNHHPHTHPHINQAHEHKSPKLYERLMPYMVFFHFLFSILTAIVFFVVIGLLFSYKKDVVQAYGKVNLAISKIDGFIDNMNNLSTRLSDMPDTLNTMNTEFQQFTNESAYTARLIYDNLLQANTSLSTIGSSLTSVQASFAITQLYLSNKLTNMANNINQMSTQLQDMQRYIDGFNATFYHYKIN